MIIVIVNELAPYVLNLIDNKEDRSIVVEIIIIFGLFFMFFMTLVFNEIIELNFFGLEYNTKKNIYIRSKVEEDKNFQNPDESIEVSFGNYTANLEMDEDNISYHENQS